MKKRGLTPDEHRTIAVDLWQLDTNVKAMMTRLNGHHTPRSYELWWRAQRDIWPIRSALDHLTPVSVEPGIPNYSYFGNYARPAGPTIPPFEVRESVAELVAAGRGAEAIAAAVRAARSRKRSPLAPESHAAVGRFLKQARASLSDLYIHLSRRFPLSAPCLRAVKKAEGALSNLRCELDSQICHDYPDLPCATHYYYGADGPEAV